MAEITQLKRKRQKLVGIPAIVDRVSEKTRYKKQQCTEIATEVFRALAAEAKKGSIVRIPELGSFRVVMRAARNGRNPATGERIAILAHRELKFKSRKGK